MAFANNIIDQVRRVAYIQVLLIKHLQIITDNLPFIAIDDNSE